MKRSWVASIVMVFVVCNFFAYGQLPQAVAEEVLTYIDLYKNGVVATRVQDMSIHTLNKGQYTLRVEIVGANEKAVKKYMFGLDYLKLEEVQLAKPGNVKYNSPQDTLRW